MKKRLFQLFLVSSLSLFSTLCAQISTAKWQVQPIVIDGDGSDWGMLPRFFNTESNIKYEFRNDGINLYFILKAADMTTQIQLYRAGFSVKFKLKNSTPSKAEITFKPNKLNDNQPMNIHEVRTDKLVDKSISRPEFIPKDTVILDGFLFTNGILSSDNKENICFARNNSRREFATYEIQIPLRELFGSNYTLEKIAQTQIQLQVSINDLSQNEMRKMHGRMGGEMHGNGRGMQNGTEMGGLGQPGSEMNAEMPTEMRGGFSMERKSFNKDFLLSSGK